jgi:hypothetical protein
VGEYAAERHQQDGYRDRNQRIQPQQGPQPERRKHRQHQVFAMGEIDDVHQSEDQAQAGCDQGVDQAHQQPADDRLRYDFKCHSIFGF